jgi:para-aminobenzoate synthetase component 1
MQLDSCVLIRFIEQKSNGQLVYKSGGGITIHSEAEKEYEELLNKIYVPRI